MPSRPIVNVHQRRFAATAETVGALIDQLGGPDDRLWPSDRWPAMEVPRPITVGDRAGHADVRYTVDKYVPGEVLWFRFNPSSGLIGRHGVLVEPMSDGTIALTHRLEGQAVGPGRLMWPLLIRWMHDQLLEELLDNAEDLLPGAVRPIPPAELAKLNGRSRWARFVRLLFVGVGRLQSIPQPVALGIAVVGLSGAAAVHALWATGMNWPGVDRVDLARKVVGTEVFPTNRETWMVVGLLGVATGLTVVAAKGVRNPKLRRVVGVGAGGVAAVLAVRAVGGFALSTGRLLGGSTAPFVRRDLLVYSPLCAILAAATASATMRRPQPSPNETLVPGD
jgi:Protein of unknown function (DUF3995)